MEHKIAPFMPTTLRESLLDSNLFNTRDIRHALFLLPGGQLTPKRSTQGGGEFEEPVDEVKELNEVGAL